LVAVFSEGGESFAMGSRGTNLFVQTITHRYFLELKGLPVPWVLVTTHEGKGEDDNKRAVFGPMIVGKAGIDKIPGWFEHTIHFEKFSYLAGDKKTMMTGSRMYFDSHADAQLPSVIWPAKVSMTTKRKWELQSKFRITISICA
jgi:hypothetical protein